MDIESIFRYQVPNAAKLCSNGFREYGTEYRKEIEIMQNRFRLLVTVSNNGNVSFKVIDNSSNEEYALVHVDSAQGGFVGEIRSSCEKVLKDIAQNCFDTERFQAEQAKRMIAYIEQSFAVKAEFLWKNSSSCIFRRADNHKWFAAILTVERNKLGLSGQGTVEIIDLKDEPSQVIKRVNTQAYLPAYHMNKKYWYTVCLDGTVSDDELNAGIQNSYAQAKG